MLKLANWIKKTVTINSSDMNIRKKLIGLVLLLLPLCAGAQNFALKTNLYADAAAAVNLGAEIGLAPKWTFDINGDYMGWRTGDYLKFITNSDEASWKHWFVQPEVRYWFCDRFMGHFVGVHAIGGQFNLGNADTPFSFLGNNWAKLKDHRYQGWGAGAGVGYGYDFALSKHWNLELEAGIGFIHCWYDVYNCAGCGRKLNNDTLQRNYFGPTKLAINLVYLF